LFLYCQEKEKKSKENKSKENKTKEKMIFKDKSN